MFETIRAISSRRLAVLAVAGLVTVYVRSRND